MRRRPAPGARFSSASRQPRGDRAASSSTALHVTASSSPSGAEVVITEGNRIPDDCRFEPRLWEWQGHQVRWCRQTSEANKDSSKVVLLVHGFGASISHFRFNIPKLIEDEHAHTVYAVDLLGLGGSEKPPKPAGRECYSMELWRDQLIDFIEQVIYTTEGKEVELVLVGNSIGSLAVLHVMSHWGRRDSVQGIALLNCAGGMNNKIKFVPSEYMQSGNWATGLQVALAQPILALIDFLLNNKSIARNLFDNYRSKENVEKVLTAVYSNKANVDAELVNLIHAPSEEVTALDVFVSILTSDPGPRPKDLLPKLAADLPILLLWGEEDPFTPIDGDVGTLFQELAEARDGGGAAAEADVTTGKVSFVRIAGAGHCPHDDRPEEVHSHLLPWLRSL